MELINFFKKTFLFQGLDNDLIKNILSETKPIVVSYKRGEEVYNSQSGNRRVGFILEGKCEIRKVGANDKCVVINILEPCSSFGILSALSTEEFPTHIFATKNTKIIYFEQSEIISFVNNYSQISSNLITFLVSRIHFLNKKIATFSGTKVENRLAAYLIYEKERKGSDLFYFNCLKASEEINAGRASVYRALYSFEQNKIIKFTNNKIQITDLEGLERIAK